MRYQKLGFAASGVAANVDANTQTFEPLGDARRRAMQDMADVLVEQGLYEKEARAMVNTWQDQWYAEEGTRVLYLLPQAWTDRTLALQVTPQPDSVVRVMVGRAELITPATERELRKQILTFRTGDAKAKAQAVAEVRALRLGRFLNAAMTRITLGETDPEIFRSVWELAGAARAEKVASPAKVTPFDGVVERALAAFDQKTSAREDERSARN
jgi:hypothetical protein